MLKLLELQETDLKIDRLLGEIAVINKKEEKQKIASEFKKYQKNYEKIKAEHKAESSKLKQIESQISQIEDKTESEDKRLYSGKVNDPKELASIQKEIESLQKQKDALETNELEQLDVVARLTENKTKHEQFLLALKKKYDQLGKADKESLAAKEKELESLAGERERIIAVIPGEELEAYQSMRVKLGGRVVARLEDNMCGSCSMRLPSDEVDQMLINRNRLWTCSNCSRILIVG